MGLYPKGLYSRVTHHNDIVVHNPISPFFKHAGNEVWYKDSENTYKECENDAGLPENKECTNSLFWKNGIPEHMNYMGHPFKAMCDKPNKDFLQIEFDDLEFL